MSEQLHTGWPVEFDVLELDHGAAVKTGVKVFRPAIQPLSRWIGRPDTVKGAVKEVRPPMNGWKVRAAEPGADRAVLGFLGYLVNDSNDVQNSGACHLTSGPSQRGVGWSVLPANLHQSLVCLAARLLVKATWLNDKDCFSVPADTEASRHWQDDCQVFALFHAANQTSSLGNVVYQGQTYDIRNSFFWVDPQVMLQAPGIPLPLYNQCQTAMKTPGCQHLDDLLAARRLSPAAVNVVRLGRQLVTASMGQRLNAYPKYQLNRWDAGWYQVAFGLYKDTPFTPAPEASALWQEFKAAFKALGDLLRPGLYEHGLLPRERLYSATS